MRKFGLYTMDGAGNASTFIRPGEIVPTNLTDIFLGLGSSWEVDIWGKLRNQKKSAISSYLSSIEGTNFVISNLVANVAIQYTELQSLDNELRVIRQTIRRQQDALDVVRWQKEAGRATELAVQQFGAQLLNAQALEHTVLQQITEAENKVNLLMGRFPHPVERNPDGLFAPVPQQIAAGVPSQLLANRPDIREAELQVQASHYDLKAAKAAFYPQFNITGTLGFQAFNAELLFTAPESLAYSAMGGLVTPIINLGAFKAHFQAVKSNQLTAMYNYQKTIVNAYVEVANELANIRNLEAFSTRKREQRDMLRKAVDTSDELYKRGRASYLEVLMAQQNALQAGLELIQATKQRRVAQISVYRALGGGWK